MNLTTNSLKKTSILIFVIAIVFAWTISVQADTTTYSTIKDAGAALRTALIMRGTAIPIDIYPEKGKELSNDYLIEVKKSIFREAIKHTGKGEEGDYLLFNLDNITRKVETVQNNEGETVIRCSYEPTWRDGYDKETETTHAIKEALEELNCEDKTEEEKIKIIYDYITKNVNYDYESYYSDSNKDKDSWTAYGAIVNKKAVCQGYALLLYRMLNDEGIECRIVTGLAESEDGQKPHAWNAIRRNDEWYYADATWDSALSEKGMDYKFYVNQPMTEVTDLWKRSFGVAEAGL